MNNLEESFWNSIKQAAKESNWVPKEYYMNDWVSDVCNFLRNRGEENKQIQDKEKEEKENMKEEKKVTQRKEESTKEKVEKETEILLETSRIITTVGTTVVNLQKRIVLRKANKPLILIDSSDIPIAEEKSEEDKPRFDKIHKKKRVKCLPITFDIRQIIDYWAKKGLPGHREDSAAFAQAVEYITKAFDGCLFDKFIEPSWHRYRFRVDTMKQSIDNFYLAAFDERYEPTNIKTKQYLQRMRLVTFLYNPYMEDDKSKSQLLRHNGRPKLACESKYLAMKDNNPYCTKLVNEWYKQEFGGVIREVTRSQQNSMIQVSRKLEEFLASHKDKLNMDYEMRMYGDRNPLNFLTRQLLRCASKMLRENDGLRSRFKPHWLISENMISDRFEDFLIEESLMK